MNDIVCKGRTTGIAERNNYTPRSVRPLGKIPCDEHLELLKAAQEMDIDEALAMYNTIARKRLSDRGITSAEYFLGRALKAALIGRGVL